MRMFVTLVPEEHDDMKTNEDIDKIIDLSMDLTRLGLEYDMTVSFKLTNLPPTRNYPGFDRLSRAIDTVRER